MVLKRGSKLSFCGHTFTVGGMKSVASKDKYGNRQVSCDITLTGVRTFTMGHQELESRLEDGSITIL